MTVIGRLWRRAPAFRVCVVVAFASAALAAMFPPHLPPVQGLLHKQAASTQPHFTPQADPAPLDYSTIDMPPLTTGRTTLIPFAGRQLPLPAGQWLETALLRSGGPLTIQAIVLGRWHGGKLTGLMVVTGTPALKPAGAIAQPANNCVNMAGLAIHDLTPANNADPAAQECWTMRRLAVAQLRVADAHDPLLGKSLDRLDGLGVLLPAHLAASYYVRTDKSGALTLMILLPEPDTNPSAMVRRMEIWMQRWTSLLHRGFDGGLKPADVASALAHDPAAETGPS